MFTGRGLEADFIAKHGKLQLFLRRRGHFGAWRAMGTRHQQAEDRLNVIQVACQSARPQTRRINLVGLNHRPEDGRVGDKGVCKLCAWVHAQIMAGDLPRVLICTIDFASIAWPNKCAACPKRSRRAFFGVTPALGSVHAIEQMHHCKT